MFKTLKNAWKIQEIQNKILFTLLIILLYRVGSAIPVPYVQAGILDSFNAAYGGTIFNYMSILSGGAMAQATLFALSVSPYITSSIVIQLLTVAFPDSLGKIAKDGEEGQKKVKKWTRYVTVGIALVTAYGYTALLANNGWLDSNHIQWGGMWASNGFAGTVNTLVIIASYVAGAAVIMWLAELIDAKGIGNGISMILFFNIISRGPSLIGSLWNMIAYNKNGLVVGILLGILSVAVTAGMVLLVVWVTHSERRIPIQYAKRVVGRKMYGGQGTNLPIKLNMTGVMPIIFASSIVSVPATIATFFAEDNGFRVWVEKWLGPQSWIYVIVYIVLIVAFAYFYILISFNPIEVANNIKNNGGSVPGIRTGKPTADYITKILNRITLIGAFFLIVVAGLPMIINIVSGGSFAGLAFGGSSLLIVVGVALEVFTDIEAQITMRNYKGFLD
ncbi:MAG: preprotein translocase subunit SecY [Clostridia bacterium]|nr:preprotein translocase subunit SecY [Clostridia bacterium]